MPPKKKNNSVEEYIKKIKKLIKKFLNIKRLIKKTIIYIAFLIVGLTLVFTGVSIYLANLLSLSKEVALIITGIAVIIFAVLYKKLA